MIKVNEFEGEICNSQFQKSETSQTNLYNKHDLSLD